MQTACCCVFSRRKLDSAQAFACQEWAGYLEDMGGIAVRAVGCKAVRVNDLSAVDSQERKPGLATKFCNGSRVVGVSECDVAGHRLELYIRSDQERSREVSCCRD